MRNAAETTMKKKIASPTPVRLASRTIFATVIAVALMLSTITYAQPTSSSPDPKAGAETTGTIKEYTPGSILILDTLAPNEPTQFKLSKSVVYADADGKPLEAPGFDDEPEGPCPLHENRRRKRGGQNHDHQRLSPRRDPGFLNAADSLNI